MRFRGRRWSAKSSLTAGLWLSWTTKTLSAWLVSIGRNEGATSKRAVPRLPITSGFPLDNRKENLRVCTNAENTRNSIVRDAAGKSSRFKGVSKSGEGWVAQITFEGRCVRIGTFDREDDAAGAYDGEAILLFGEFALTNEMMGLFDGRSPHDDRRALKADHKRSVPRKGWRRRPDRDKPTSGGVHLAYQAGVHIFHFPPGVSPG